MCIILTPRETNSHGRDSPGQEPVQSVPYTPHGDEAAIYKYYCPLCMQYFREIMKMKCCGNYLCISCCKDYIRAKRIDMTGLDSNILIEERFMTTNPVPCPHCNVTGFHPVSVSFEEAIRDYSTRFQPQHQPPSQPGYSPLRIGESFEDLKRKMIPFKNQQSTITSVCDDLTPRDSEEQVVPYTDEQTGAPPQSAGIAMSYHGSFSPVVESNTPRVRLEPETPEFFPLYAAADDAKETMPHAQLFGDDLSGGFASYLAEEKVDFSPERRVETQALAVTGIYARTQSHPGVGSLGESVDDLLLPIEARLGSSSPRLLVVGATATPRTLGVGAVGGLSRSNSGIPRPSSRNATAHNERDTSGETGAARILSRNNSAHNVGSGADGVRLGYVGAERVLSRNNSAHNMGSATGSGRTATEAGLNLLASGVVEHVLRAAVAQRTSPTALPAVQ
jgi:hypothetical protein